MQVPQIQATNNYRKPSFNAHFVANGYFNTLWRNAEKDSYSFEKYVRNFSDHHKDHTLEIIDAKDVSADDYHVASGVEYTIYNYATDKKHRYYVPYTCAISMSGRLENMLWELFCDSKFWGGSEHLNSEMFYAASSYKKEDTPISKLYSLLTEKQ